MNNNGFVNKFLNIDRVQEFAGDGRDTLFVESTNEITACPECRQMSNSVHDLGEAQMIRDLLVAEQRCYLSYRARRFGCRELRQNICRACSLEPGRKLYRAL